MKAIKNNYFTAKRHLSDLLYRFVYVSDYENKEMYYNFGLYGFLCNEDIGYLGLIDNMATKNKIIQDVEVRCKDVFTLIKLYKYYNETNKLWDLLNNDKYKYLFINNIDELKEEHNDELYNYFIEQFYKTLSLDKKREIYQKAVKYVEAISKLLNGEKLVDELIVDLKKSEYQKCFALFEEIDRVIKKATKFN